MLLSLSADSAFSQTQRAGKQQLHTASHGIDGCCNMHGWSSIDPTILSNLRCAFCHPARNPQLHHNHACSSPCREGDLGEGRVVGPMQGGSLIDCQALLRPCEAGGYQLVDV